MVGLPSGSPVVVVGAGQAGLAVSYELTARGIEHVVLERARVGQTWRGLWDSFCLVTPNWTMSLPGAPYTDDDPEGFVPRDAIVEYLQRYASSFGAPVRERVGVDSLEPGPNGGFLLRTSAGELDPRGTVHVTYGEIPVAEYLTHIGSYRAFQAALIARLAGLDYALPERLVDLLMELVVPRVEEWRAIGIFGPEQPAPEGADRETAMLAAMGFPVR